MKSLAILLLPLACVLSAQQAVILLDPARGGSQPGAHIATHVDEKDVTLSLAQRLASLLRARGFTVELTRDSDVEVSNDARAALANTTHPIACILLHATSAGTGVHLFTTAQHQLSLTTAAVRWEEAQAPFADRSRTLRDDLKAAFPHSKISATAGTTWLKPLDNMQCPAVAVEIAPRETGGDTAEETSYQAQIASAIANTLLLWRGKVPAITPPEPAPPAPRPKPVSPATPEPEASPAAEPARQEP